MTIRLFIIALCLASASVVLAAVTESEVVPAREAFAAFPMDVAGWHGRRLPDFDERLRAELGVDEYVNAVYEARHRSEVGLYIGYYSSQRQGDTIHSPANCLPGGGWLPIQRGTLTLDVPAADGASAHERPIAVTRWLIQKGDDQQLVLYWYQSHGRVTAGEYESKINLVLDAIRLNRTDAALVRVITPVAEPTAAGRAEAERTAVSFVRAMFPTLERFLPL
jgi:EpsI family protein